MTIFGQRERVDPDVALHSETTFDYLDRSARPEMALVRDQLESWFSRYPDQPGRDTDEGRELRVELRSRLRSRRERQQTEAFWELYLHESFVRAGCGVTVHGDTPDFDVTFDGQLFHVEATVRGLSDADTSAQSRVQALRDGLDCTHVGEWILEVSFAVESSRPPLIGALRSDIEAWLRTLDVGTVLDAFEKDPQRAYTNRPGASFERDGWTVHARVTPKRRDAPQRTGRQPAIGIWGGANVVEISNAEGMVDSLATKAKRLRSIDTGAAVIVAVLLARDFADEDDIESALFGTEAVRFSRDHGGLVTDAQAVRLNNGFWSRDGRRLDAVLAATRLNPFSISRSTPLLWTNPWRHRSPFQVPASLPWAPRWVDEGGCKQVVPAPSPATFFGLAASWPET